MKRTSRTWLSSVFVGITAAAAAIGLSVAGPANATPVTPVAHLAPAAAAPAAPAAQPAAAPAAQPAAAAPAAQPAAAAASVPVPAGAKVLPHDTKRQPNFYFCGPSATRNALSVFGMKADVNVLASELGTTPDGTSSSAEITRVLNAHVGQKRYRTVELPPQPTHRQADTLRADIVTDINQNDPVVANIVGTVRDTDGQVHSYAGGHYLAVVGYEAAGTIVDIADSADPVGSPDYKLTTADLADWIAGRGYSA